MTGFIKKRWRDEGGYHQILTLAAPLILSSGAMSVQFFVDRVFLTWYSADALAASMPAGLLSFTILSLFMFTSMYVGTFVAQYYGAGRHDRIGPILWQGLYLALIAGLIHLLFIPLAGPLFQLAGHGPEIARLETIYFQILCLGAGPAVAAAALSGFFAGRGQTLPIMWVHILATTVNIILDWALIFGHLGLPALGMFGAALATILSGCVNFLVLLFLVVQGSHERQFATRSGWRPNLRLFRRLLRFGLPNGIQLCIEHIGFTLFVLLVGRLGAVPLAATNVAFNINMLAFMPMIGLGTAVSILVGQNLGRNRPGLAQRSVWSGFHLTFLYMAGVAASYVLLPSVFLYPYALQADPVAFAPVRGQAIVLLRFVAAYSLFDSMNVIFSSGIKGAGDTRFVMYMVSILSILGLALPTWVVLGMLHKGIYAAWTVATIYVCVLGLAFLTRFLGGRWKAMRVIEPKL